MASSLAEARPPRSPEELEMAMPINTNVPSLEAQRTLLKTSAGLASSMQRLSTGLRINSAKDDAAGQAIASMFTAQVSSLAVAQRNANDGISMIQTGESGLSTQLQSLQDLRALAMQAANGAASASDRSSMEGQRAALTQGLDQVANTTEYNGRKLLDGTGGSVDLQVGTQAGGDSTISVSFADTTAKSLGLDALKFDTAANARAALGTLDDAIASLSRTSGDLGAASNRFSSVISSQQSMSESLSAARSRIADTDFAAESASMANGKILKQAGIAMLAQANKASQGVLALLRG
jgi:flagellin